MAGAAEPLLCMYNAATPATCGLAAEVPPKSAMSTSLRWLSDRDPLPGANRSTQLPKFELAAFTSVVGTMFPTVMAWGVRAGDWVHALTVLFPAETTTGI